MSTVQNQQADRPDVEPVEPVNVEFAPEPAEHPTPDELWSAITDLHRRLVTAEGQLDVLLAAERERAAQAGRRHRPRHGAW